MKKYLVAVLVLLIAAAGLAVLVKTDTRLPKKKVLSEAEPVKQVKEKTEIITKDKIVISENPLINMPPYKGQPIEYLGADPIVLSQLPSQRVKQYENSLKERFVDLNSTDPKYSIYDNWISIGIYKKFFNNYTGARDAWEYAKIVEDSSPQAYLNLANLYAYYLNNLKEAEKNFLIAVSRDNFNYSGSLNQTAGFYRDFGQKELALQYYRAIFQINPYDEAVKAEIERLESSN